jgi:polyisoprenoid-binding protein YceI
MHLKNLLRFEIILIFFAFSLFVNNVFASERYTIANSKALKFTYFVSGIPLYGEFHVETSHFTIDFTEEQQSKFYIKVDIRKSTAGFPLATSAMLGQSVLNANKYPFMEFKSTSISKKDKGYRVSGWLKLKGTKKNIVILVFNKDRYKKNANTLKFEIMSSINRYDFGADGFPFLVSKEIKLNSNIELIRGD